MATISAVPPTLDLNLYAGDDVTITLTVTTDAGAPYNLTGALDAQVRKGHDLEIVATIDVQAPDPTTGICYLTLTAEQTEALGEAGGRHAWDLQLTGALGLVTTICRGLCATQLDITEVAP